jgi:hypothetical protein
MPPGAPLNAHGARAVETRTRRDRDPALAGGGIAAVWAPDLGGRRTPAAVAGPRALTGHRSTMQPPCANRRRGGGLAAAAVTFLFCAQLLPRPGTAELSQEAEHSRVDHQRWISVLSPDLRSKHADRWPFPTHTSLRAVRSSSLTPPLCEYRCPWCYFPSRRAAPASRGLKLARLESYADGNSVAWTRRRYRRWRLSQSPSTNRWQCIYSGLLQPATQGHRKPSSLFLASTVASGIRAPTTMRFLRARFNPRACCFVPCASCLGHF